jgi:hypothetical protein
MKKKKLKQFIDDNFNYFINLSINDLGNHEVATYDASEFDTDVIKYLKKIKRFDYKGICVYYDKGWKTVYVENMSFAFWSTK